MSVAAAVSSEKLETFKDLLRELFQLDYAAGLDFGIYRIINQRRREISDFLDRDLLPQVRSAFVSYQSEERTRLQDELAKAEAQAATLGVPAETSPKVRQLRETLADIPDAAALEDEVYSHLTTFFRRYYQNGDFLSLRRYKAGVYAIPYEGEEVKLYWANADQYYIKTAEAFQTYTFTLPPGRTVHFRVRQAATAQNNNKATEDGERRFVLAGDDPVAEQDGALVVLFEYRPVEGKPKQATLNKEVVERLLASPQAAAWAGELSAPSPTEANAARTLLEKHLTRYTARNTFDYFIHKDLGAFLRRELDFYLKSEVVRLDDLDTDDVAQAERYLSKVRAIKRVAHRIIDFLAQIEDFQKRLFLKKKLVLQAGYCLTLDRVPDALYPEVAANAAQTAEWKRLFAIEEIAPSLLAPAYGEPLTADFLRANPSLVLDTCFFDQDFKRRLLASFDDLDAATDGLLVCSENFQALNLLLPRYQDAVKCIYLDPPYNTGNDGFLYKDNYQHSSWLSMMRDRLFQARGMLGEDGVIFVSIDDHEAYSLRVLMNETFGSDNFLAELVWEKTRKNDAKLFSVGHEYMLVYARSLSRLKEIKTIWREPKPGAKEIMQEYHRLRSIYGDDNTAVERALGEWYKSLPKSHPSKKLSRYKHVDKNGPWRDRDISWPGGGGPRYDVPHDKTGLPCKVPERGWVFPTYAAMQEQIRLGLVEFREDHTEPPIRKAHLVPVAEELDDSIALQSVEDEEQDEDSGDDVGMQVMPSVIYRQSQVAVKYLRKLFGSKTFNNPKDHEVIARIIRYCTGSDDTILDFFAGSGTTGQAVIELNREDGGNRKYVLVEMGDYFDTVLKPRLQKVIYSKDWKDGKPVSRAGTSHMFKYLRLEQYEDTLNNLELRRTSVQQRLLETLDGNSALHEDYYLRYMLNLESRQGDPLLTLAAFETPFDYRLKVTDDQMASVDLVETFNYLLGLSVAQVRLIDGFTTVHGRLPNGETALVIWRDLRDKTNDALAAFVSEQGFLDSGDLDRLYINGDHTLEAPDTGCRVLSIEAEFLALMFDGQAM